MSHKAVAVAKDRLRFDGWCIMFQWNWGTWVEYPQAPRIVFHTQEAAEDHANMGLGFPWSIWAKWGWVPWLVRIWKVVPFIRQYAEKETSNG